MTYKLKRFFLMVILVLLILMGIGVFIYYLIASDIAQLRKLPPYLLMMVLVYILGQLAKRFFLDEYYWYGWIFYVFLIWFVIPLPFFSLQDNWIFVVTRLGGLFLILPPLIEFLTLIKAVKAGKAKQTPKV